MVPAPLDLGANVTQAEWGLERVTIQNPRIRTYLGCIRLFEEAQEGNYKILHCSPERLLEVWSSINEVAEKIEGGLRPLLEPPSKIPRLERARRMAFEALDALSSEVFVELRRLESEGDERDLFEVREVLCRSIGRIHSFLLDSFAEIVANDPRSTHGADYFLSKRFPEEVEHAERLYAEVERLERFVAQVDRAREQTLPPLIDLLERDGKMLDGPTWNEAAAFLDSLVTFLTPKLREVLALSGIRFYEMSILDRYSAEIPAACEVLISVHDLGMAAISRIDQTAGVEPIERARMKRVVEREITAKLASELRGVDDRVRKLARFAPGWREKIGSRRALWLTDDNAIERARRR